MYYFKPMLECPKNNPFYITKESGGLNPCKKGRPVCEGADALANCISFVVGRFNEVAGESWCHYFGSMNASSFYIVAKRDYNFPTSTMPEVGAIACFSGGVGGKGHVYSVEAFKGNHEWIIAESGYNNYAFRNRVIKDTDKNFGMPASFKFQGFVINPFIKQEDPKEKINKLLEVASDAIESAKKLLSEV